MPRLVLPALFLVALAGCSSGPTFGTVSGVVRVNGQPAAKVRVEFHPDPGTVGPSSTGETDADGRYTLQYAWASGNGPGAAVGRHRVVLADLQLAESETGKGLPIRLPADYTELRTTPLVKDVAADDQTIDIDINPK